MQNYSKYFKLDAIDTNQTLKPVIVITDSNDNVLFTLSQDQDELFDNNGDSVDVINSISKVSNVKISNDYDTKTLKINRLRCTLYNYYDVNTKLSQYINTGIINKNLYLFYKSPTTNIINLSDVQNDYDCALIYAGEISRINYDDDSINITAEDKTQIKISDKQVPYMSVDRLDQNITNNIPKSYQDDDAVVPMTFGKVDKAPVLPYVDNDNQRFLKILIDIQPTTANYTTARIPSLLEKQPNGVFNCLYVKESDDYIIWNHKESTITTQNKLYSSFTISTQLGSLTDLILPEISSSFEDLGLGNLWDITGFYQRLVNTVYATNINEYAGGSGTLSFLSYSDLTDEQLENISSINDNGGYNKIWYREGDSIGSHNNNFDTGVRNFERGIDSDTGLALNNNGEGRWIILKLEDGVSNDLINLQIDGSYAGNTFILSDWKLYQDEDMVSTPNLYSSGVKHSGFFIVPVVEKIYTEIFHKYPRTSWAGLNALLLETEEQYQEYLDIISSEEPDMSALESFMTSPIDSAFCYDKCAYRIERDTAYVGGSRYWESYGSNNGLNDLQLGNQWKRINGLNYGDRENILAGQSNEYNHIVMFEFFNNNALEVGESFQQGLKMNNTGFLHNVKVENVLEKEIYASVVGRRNEFFTSQLSPDYQMPLDDDGIPDILFSDILATEDESTINSIRGKCYSIMYYWWRDSYFEEAEPLNLYNTLVGNVTGDALDFLFPKNSSRRYPQSEIDKLSPEFWNTFTNKFNNFDKEDILGSRWNANFTLTPMGALSGSYTLFKDYFVNMALLPSRLMQTIDGHTLSHSNAANWSLLADAENNPDIDYGELNHRQFYFQSSISHQSHPFNSGCTYGTDFIVSLSKYFYQYVYQREFGGDYNFDFFLICKDTSGYNHTWGEGQKHQQNIDMSAFTDSLMDWDILPDNATLQDWVDNLYLYLDDFIDKYTQHFTEGVNQALLSTVPPYEDDSSHLFTSNTYDNSLSSLEGDSIFIDFLEINISNFYLNENPPDQIPTSYIVKKPSDIVMNILTGEMGFSKYNEEVDIGDEIVIPDYNGYDIESIEESRDLHNGWEMGFSINKKTDGKKLIEGILKESKSYPRFTSDGKFGLITIKDSYEYNDIDKIIDVNDIISYNFTQTKREDVITSVKMFYRYDYGLKKYNNYKELKIEDIFSEYVGAGGYNYYNIDSTNIDTHKDINLKYHTESNTVDKFAKYTLLNNCNVHNEVNMKLPLNYAELEVGDKIHIPLINNTKAFDIDYSKVDFLNGQPVYPLWIIMSTDLGVDSISIKAVQLHYLGTDGNHGFQMPDESSYDIVGNMKQFNSNYTYPNGEPIPNYNFNPAANIDSGIEIPYFDLSGNGLINVNDIQMMINHIKGGAQLTESQKNRLPNDDIINVVDIVAMVNIILQYE